MTITRVFEFDAAHRIMNERVKCFNLHGHRFRLEVTFNISEKYWDLGYPIDFKELKRVFGGFIDTYLDHSCILNPKDTEVVKLCSANNWRLWTMGLGYSTRDMNPSAENLADELFVVFREIAKLCPEDFDVNSVRLYETPNCWVEIKESTTVIGGSVKEFLASWRRGIGNFEYDSRKCR